MEAIGCPYHAIGADGVRDYCYCSKGEYLLASFFIVGEIKALKGGAHQIETYSEEA